MSVEAGNSLESFRKGVEKWLGEERGRSRRTLAAKCGMDESQLSKLLSGGSKPPLYAFLNLISTLGVPASPALFWWLEKEVGKETRRRSSGGPREQARKAALEFLQRLSGGDGASEAEEPKGPPNDLMCFPEAFAPTTVFVGDRRERPPRNLGDVLAATASTGDIFYLPSLGLDAETQIRSDKSAKVVSREALGRSFDRNLLIIGSPAVNLVAREANKSACFAFALSADSVDRERLVEEEWLPEGEDQWDPEKLESFVTKYPEEHVEQFLRAIERSGAEAEHVRELALKLLKPSEQKAEQIRGLNHMVSGFSGVGFIDPVKFVGLRGQRRDDNTDYGVVSLCRHPWVENKVAVIAAGIGGAGTAAAVKLLGQPDNFRERPLGGVFRVHTPDAPWEKRYHYLRPKWETKAYTIPSYLADLRESLSNRDHAFDQGNWSSSSVDEFVESLIGRTAVE